MDQRGLLPGPRLPIEQEKLESPLFQLYRTPLTPFPLSFKTTPVAYVRSKVSSPPPLQTLAPADGRLSALDEYLVIEPYSGIQSLSSLEGRVILGLGGNGDDA